MYVSKIAREFDFDCSHVGFLPGAIFVLFLIGTLSGFRQGSLFHPQTAFVWVPIEYNG